MGTTFGAYSTWKSFLDCEGIKVTKNQLQTTGILTVVLLCSQLLLQNTSNEFYSKYSAMEVSLQGYFEFLHYPCFVLYNFMSVHMFWT